eukprot:6197723-Pleurochrysis_carterae.AAC.4
MLARCAVRSPRHMPVRHAVQAEEEAERLRKESLEAALQQRLKAEQAAKAARAPPRPQPSPNLPHCVAGAALERACFSGRPRSVLCWPSPQSRLQTSLCAYVSPAQRRAV